MLSCSSLVLTKDVGYNILWIGFIQVNFQIEDHCYYDTELNIMQLFYFLFLQENTMDSEKSNSLTYLKSQMQK